MAGETPVFSSIFTASAARTGELHQIAVAELDLSLPAVTGQAADILGLAVSGLGGEQHLVVVKQAPDRTLLLFGDHHTDAVNALNQGLGICDDEMGFFRGMAFL